jgi:hypothetical protein
MFDRTPDKADASADDIPIVERTEEEWQDHFRTLFRDKLDSIFEIAKQITIFHDEVNRDPFRWSGGWNTVCKRVVKLDHTTCSTYETIHKVFSVGSVLTNNRAILPARTHTLYLIARAFEKHEPTVSEAIQVRLIHPEMNQDEGRQLLRLADDNFRREASEHGPFEEVKPTTAAGPTTTAGADTEAADEKEPEAAAAPKKGKQASKKDAAAKDDEQDDERSDGYERPKSLFTPPPPPKININSEIRKIAEEFGELYDERLVRHILTWRADHPRIFAAINMWDARFGPMAVTLALRQLGYQPSVETTIVV